MKRKIDILSESICQFTRSKKPKIFYTYIPEKRPTNIVSATHIKNFMCKDPLIDYLKLKNKRDSVYSNFVNYIMQRGRDFETEIVKLINLKYPVVSVSEKITKESCKNTLKYMEDGVPIIHSAPFIDRKERTQGIIDFLVRSDYMHTFTGINPLPIDVIKKGYNKPYHYIVLDVKFSTLPLRADGVHLLNSGNFPFYKSQLYIYTKAIGNIQNYFSRYSYILGRRWRQTLKGDTYNSLECFDRLGQIDYEGVDAEYKERTMEALNWVRDLRKNWKKWSLYPPSRPELYPNMCRDSGTWNNEKEEIAQNLGDITQIWYCGIKNREKALQKNILSWRDKRCNSKNLGMGGIRGEVIDKIIKINRDSGDIISPKKIKNNLFEWKNPCNEVFVDFETFSDIFAPFSDLPLQIKTDRIFMVGVYYSNNGMWTYKYFLSEADTDKAELEMMKKFSIFMKEQGFSKMWYWHAESYLWERAEKRLESNMSPEDLEEYSEVLNLKNWADLSKIFREEPIVIKGCFKFGLKEVSKALFNHGLISTKMSSKCKSGSEASINAWNAYKENSDNISQDPRILDIAEYNKFDVVVLKDILDCIRKLI